ncbi:hypothetical protein E2542_SST09320 [Spatholobus suberectus]|nr:hypothetical protein E2542_SST09320 [Spatholobus suberectus]
MSRSFMMVVLSLEMVTVPLLWMNLSCHEGRCGSDTSSDGDAGVDGGIIIGDGASLAKLSSEARLVPQFSTMDKKINSKFGLRELIYNVRNGKWHGKRSMLGGRLERVSPAGPDPDHH